MSTTRVHLLATELGVKSKAIIDKCKAEGLDNITNHMSTISAGRAATIREWANVLNNARYIIGGGISIMTAHGANASARKLSDASAQLNLMARVFEDTANVVDGFYAYKDGEIACHVSPPDFEQAPLLSSQEPETPVIPVYNQANKCPKCGSNRQLKNEAYHGGWGTKYNQDSGLIDITCGQCSYVRNERPLDADDSNQNSNTSEVKLHYHSLNGVG